MQMLLISFLCISCGSLFGCGGGGGGGNNTTPEVIDQARIQGTIPLSYNDCPGSAPLAALDFDLYMVQSRLAESDTIEIRDFSQPEGGLNGYAIGGYSAEGEDVETPDSLEECFASGTVFVSTPSDHALGNFIPGYDCTEGISWAFYAIGTTIVAPQNRVTRNSFISCNKTNAEPVFCSVTYEGSFANLPVE